MADKNSRLAEIRKKFQNQSTSFVPTPQAQFGAIKKSKQDQAKAVRIAKARAARYNMTLRSLAIKSSQKMGKDQKQAAKAKKEARARAAKYNMTARALPVQAGMKKKDQQNIAKALNENVSPSVAKDVIKAVAHRKHEDDVQATNRFIKNQEKDQVKETKPEPSAEEATKEEKKEHHKSAQRIEMNGVSAALASGDEQALNRAILKNFLETNAPKLVGNVDNMLDEYKEKLEDLFDSILKKYPDAADAEVSGQLKADKEIADAVGEGDVPVVEEALDDVDDQSIIQEAPEEPPKVFDSSAVEVDDDDDSLIVDTDKAFQDSYENTIKAAEENPRKAAHQSIERRKETVRLDKELTKELNTTYNPKNSEINDAESESSLVQADTPTMLDGGYIVSAELEEEEEEEKQEPSRWAVQFQNKNYALKQKLLKQGLSKNQVDDLVNNLDTNTSEML